MNNNSFKYPFSIDDLLRNKHKLKKELIEREGLIEKRIAILSGSTIGEIKNILELFFLYKGIKPIFYESDYNQFYEEAVFKNDKLKLFKPELIYIHTTFENLKLLPSINDEKKIVKDILVSEKKKFSRIWDSLIKNFNCILIQNNFEFPTLRPLGNLDSHHENGITRLIIELNKFFGEQANDRESLFINDINYLSSLVGLNQWKDRSKYHLYKYAVSFDVIPILCDNISSIVYSIYGLSKKNIVLDLDNTMWGGIIGDDGPANIKIGAESSSGEAFLYFQNYIKELSNRGILLSIASKNDEKIAEKGFERKESVLDLDSFVAKYINWERKDENILKISNDLNLGLDSFVFIDDNPVERELVQENIPQIGVIDANNPEEMLTLLDRSGYFEPSYISVEDLKRNSFYKSNLKFEKEKSLDLGDYGSFLSSLKMIARIEFFQKEHLNRITQLVNKTNQFNLNKNRIGRSEIDIIFNSKNYLAITGSLNDKYAEHGLVSVIVGEIVKSTLQINTWVMSCRVFNRELEFAMFDFILKECRNCKIKKINAIYKKTDKNNIVKHFYKNLGFKLQNESNSSELWLFELPKRIRYYNKHIKVNK